MPTNQVLRTAGKIAGLSGLALAVFLLIFQGVIQFGLRGAISSLSPASSFAVLNSLMSFTFGIAAIGLIAALIAQGPPRARVASGPLYALCLLIFAVFATTVAVGFLSMNRVVAGDTSTTPPPPDALRTTEFVVCIGEFAERCPAGSVHLGCGSSVDAWAATQCTKSSSTRLSDVSGNRCGYYTAKVICQKKL